MADVQIAAELELGTRRRGDSSSSSSSTTRELLLGVARSLPAPLAELVEQLLAEGEEAAAVSVAVGAANRLCSRPRRRATEPEIRLDPGRAQACNGCPELVRCGGAAAGCSWERCRGRCGSCGVRCPARRDLAAWQRDVGGLGLEDLNRVFPAVPRLPPLVPVVESNELLRWGVAGEWPTWALSLANAHSKRTGAPWSTWTDGGSGGGSPPERLRAAGARRLVLTGVMNDQRLAALWPAVAQRRLVVGFDLVLAPAWSVYETDPRLEHLYAIRQSALVADLMARVGPVVPTLNWYRRQDLDRQLAWLEKTEAAAIAVDCSTLSGARRWREVRSALAYIRTVLPHVELHLYGASSADRVEDLVAFDRVVLYSARPAALARTRQILDEGLRPRPGPEDPGLCLLTSLGHLLDRLSR
ncbi:MAG: hypothetical protein DLM58_01350 [Pseudonocardiales bacterium]|nr:MAG: hypothetical protein DLM58_01350 [Pseudonocardiales bacterium]